MGDRDSRAVSRPPETPAKRTPRAYDAERKLQPGAEATVYCVQAKLAEAADVAEADFGSGRALSCFLTKLEEAAQWLREAARQ